ncbi:MAG: prolyl oligopeptidase family serine peptidase, partial [Phycisphaerales bacterium]|nr:prolyl oligopeptidase family serine peptidase [Phycisphaerales bacterium]
RVEHVDTYHGSDVPDPYRWLEDDARKSEDVAKWVEAQNEVTFNYLESIPQRDPIRQRLTALWDYEKYTAPFKEGGRYYFLKNDGLQNQYVMYTMDSLKSEPRVLFDPNTWSKDGTVALAGTFFSDDGKYVAYGIADAGSDWRKYRIREIATETDLPETIEWVKFSGASWTLDGKGFFYGRYDAPPANADTTEFQAVNKFQKLYYHRVGTPQSQDVLVYHRPDEPDWSFGPTVTEDGRYLIITVGKGTDDKYRIFYKDLTEPYGLPIELINNFDAEYSFIGNDGPVFYFKTDLDAPRGRIIAIDTQNPSQENWKELLPQSKDTLQGVSLVANMFVASYLKDAVTAVKLFKIDGTHVRDVQFPGLGSAGGFSGKRTDMDTFYGYSSFITPPSTYRYDLVTGKSTLLQQAKVDLNPSEYETKQIFYQSKDGTKVPMFIVHRKDIRLDGSNPTLLYGYGGFNIPLTPNFSISRVAWLEMGGVFAMPNLRGGGEYGEEWHKAGTKLNKQNVFDDFIAAAEWLVENQYTSPKKLAIQGGSNGGLLIGAVTNQRPDLFGACLPAVGVMDMLRFHKFTIGWAWVDDYGSSDNAEEFKALSAYSPYHNVRQDVKYPPTLITTADTDDRVVPGHSFKYAAALQYAQTA